MNKEVIQKIATLFCQHCKAIQKVNKMVAECLYNPLTEEGSHAFCASNQDMVQAIISQAKLVDLNKLANKWLEEPCTEHPDCNQHENKNLRHTITCYPMHRVHCLQCWAKIKKEITGG